MILKFLLIIYGCFLAGVGLSASFNCSKAATHVEKSICASPELSELDERNNRSFKGAIYSLNESKACFKEDQKLWLKSIRNLCRDDECLKTAYLNRLSELNGLQPGATFIKDIDLPSVPSLAWIIPPLEEDSAPKASRQKLEVTGTLMDELADGDGFTIRTKSGQSYLLALSGLLNGATAITLPSLAKDKNSLFMARGYKMSNENGEVYFDPSRCVFIYRLP